MNVAEFPTLADTQERLAVDNPTADLDRSSRENSVKNAVAITEMEGGHPSAYCRELLALFEAGEISVTEMRDRVVSNASRSRLRSVCPQAGIPGGCRRSHPGRLTLLLP